MKTEDVKITEEELDILNKVRCYKLLTLPSSSSDNLHKFGLISPAGESTILSDNGQIIYCQVWAITNRGEILLRHDLKTANDWLKHWAKLDGIIDEEKS